MYSLLIFPLEDWPCECFFCCWVCCIETEALLIQMQWIFHHFSDFLFNVPHFFSMNLLSLWLNMLFNQSGRHHLNSRGLTAMNFTVIFLESERTAHWPTNQSKHLESVYLLEAAKVAIFPAPLHPLCAMKIRLKARCRIFSEVSFKIDLIQAEHARKNAVCWFNEFQSKS